MRTIKFRAWDNDSKQMLFKEGWTLLELTANYSEWKDKNLTWEQFTGLSDKNGKEIYEGGKVYCEDAAQCDRLPEEGDLCPTGVIVWDNEGYAWVVRWDDDDSTDLLRDVDIESIGTTHDKE